MNDDELQAIQTRMVKVFEAFAEKMTLQQEEHFRLSEESVEKRTQAAEASVAARFKAQLDSAKQQLELATRNAVANERHAAAMERIGDALEQLVKRP